MIIQIPFKTPTINHLYGQRGFQRYLTSEAKKIKKKIQNICEGMKGIDGKVKIRVEIFENWHTLKGEIKKKDIANREKFLIDSIFESLGMDDSQIFKHIMIKRQGEEKAIVIIHRYEDDNKNNSSSC